MSTAVEPSTEPEVHVHHHQGFRFESRLSRSATPRLNPVVLIGGGLQRKESWGRMETGMLPVADVIATDLPGWGAADLLPAEHGVEVLAASLLKILDDHDIDRANLLAGSYGTAIAYRLAQTHPERVNRMLLIGTMCAIPEPHRQTFTHLADLVEAGDLERFTDDFLELVMPPELRQNVVASGVVQRILRRRCTTIDADEAAKFVANTRRLLLNQMVDTAEGPRVPTLVTTGEHDVVTPPAHCRELAATCSESWFVEFKQADHMVHLERTLDMVDLMTRFYGSEPIQDLPYANVIEDLKAVPVG